MKRRILPASQSHIDMVNPTLGIELLRRLIAQAEQMVSGGTMDFADIQAWNNHARPVMERALGDSSPSIGSVMHTSGGVGIWSGQSDSELWDELRGQMTNKIKLLRSCIQTLETDIEVAARTSPAPDSSAPAKGPTPFDTLLRLGDRFHVVARQLRIRQRGRTPFSIADEYDVQDLLHALLRLEFDDVRPEEYAPSYAGGSSRMDFLLKKEQIVVEAKCTRPGLNANEVGKQLLIDIARYRQHQNCKQLLCFVYDPEQLLDNPRGLEVDLSGDQHGLPVTTLIRP